MLDKLAENHKKWIAIAYNMCKCKDKANDIVQDMYIKMYELNKSVDDGYIYFVIRSIFIEEKRKQKEYSCDFNGLEQYSIDNFYNDTVVFKAKFFLEKINFDEEKDNSEDLKKECYDLAYKKLEHHEKVIIHFSSTMGLREFARNSEISISLIQKTKRKLKILIWEETKKYEELEMLSRKLQKQLE